MTTPTREQYIDPEIDRTLEELASIVPATTAREVMVRSRLTALAQRAYSHGESAAILSLITTQQMAAILGRDESTVRRVAARHDIGWMIGRDRIYRPEDIERFRALQRDVS